MLGEIRALVEKEIRLELKQRYMINGILLYLISTIFVAWLAFENTITAETWNSLFWIILLFVAVNGISKSFIQESPDRYLYYYSVVSPGAVILAKIIYNLLLMTFLSLLAFGFFLLLMGNIIVNIPLFIGDLLLGSLGLSSVLTLVSAVASRASRNFSLMAILSFPIMLPLLGLLIRVSRSALSTAELAVPGSDLGIIALLNLSVIALAYLLFPYLWRD